MTKKIKNGTAAIIVGLMLWIEANGGSFVVSSGMTEIETGVYTHPRLDNPRDKYAHLHGDVTVYRLREMTAVQAERYDLAKEYAHMMAKEDEAHDTTASI